MAHFYGVVQGSRGEVHRVAGKPGGMRTVAKGWSFGVEVSLQHDATTGRDYARIYHTHLSRKLGEERLLVLELWEGQEPPALAAFVTFAQEFLKEFESAEDVNAANRRLVRTARKLLGRK